MGKKVALITGITIRELAEQLMTAVGLDARLEFDASKRAAGPTQAPA